MSVKVFGKWQTASRQNRCDACHEEIWEGEKYFRSIEVTDEQLEEFSKSGLRRFWDFAAHNRLPMNRHHMECWFGSDKAESRIFL